MKLNPDCVRDILLTVEDLTGYNQHFTYPSENCPRLEQYTPEEVKYHFCQCGKADFIEIDTTIDDSFEVYDLTPAGHEFIANIRKDSFFSKVKDICKELGLSSLKDIAHISTNASALIIKSYFDIS